METVQVRLPAVLDLAAAVPLWRTLCAARGQPLQLDAADVERLGALCLQALLAAQTRWGADGLSFSIENASPHFLAAARLMAANDLVSSETVQ